VAAGIAFVFVLICAVAAYLLTQEQPGTFIIVAAAAFGVYMTLNIGANDVVNNIGLAVGAKVLTMGAALVIAVVFETAGALIAGVDKASTIPGGSVAPEAVADRRKSLKKLFAVPLIMSAALLSFAHGANDVANAVGPLAAIVDAVQDHGTAAKVGVPLWVMVIGAFGISFGLLLFGPRLIRMVGQETTKLNPMRAYCVAILAAITVIIASWLGLPVSSTHIAVGGVFGVGFEREWHAERRTRALNLQKGTPLHPDERRRHKLVRQVHVASIAAAWVITVPLTAALSAVLFPMLRAIG